MTQYGGEYAIFKICLGVLIVISCVAILGVIITHGTAFNFILPVITGLGLWLGQRGN